MSARKWWTEQELVQDMEHWEKEQKRCFLKSLGSRTPEQHDYWLGKQNGAHEKARASRLELERRKAI